MEHFEEAFAQEMSLSVVMAGPGDDGSVHTCRYHGRMTVQGRTVPCTWFFEVQQNGNVPEIHLEAEDSHGSRSAIEAAANLFVQRVLDAALADHRYDYVSRLKFLYFGAPLDGFYRWGKLRIAPADVHDSFTAGEPVERVLLVDQQVQEINAEQALKVSVKRASVLMHRLSLILRLGFRHPESRWRWIETEGRPERQLTRVRQDGLPKRGRLADTKLKCPTGRAEGHLVHPGTKGNPMSFPREWRKILRAAGEAEEHVRSAFDGCARLYHLSLLIPAPFQSPRLTLKVASVEALAVPEFGHGGFSEFMRKYHPTPEYIEGELDRLYRSVRSATIHAGVAHLGDVLGATEFYDRQGIERLDFASKGENAMRLAVVAWIQRHFVRGS